MGIGSGPKAGKVSPCMSESAGDGKMQSVSVRFVDGVYELICVIEVSFLSIRIVPLLACGAEVNDAADRSVV